MVAKKKPSTQSANAAEKKASAKKKSAPNTFTYKGQTVTGIKSAPTAAITAKGQKATGLSQRPAPQRGTSLRSEPKVKVKNAESGLAGSGTPLGASIAMSRPGAKRNIARAAATAAGLRVVSGVSVGGRIVVSEATKKLQRELSSELKSRSGKGMSRAQRQVQGERISELSPEEYMEYRDIPNQLRGQIARSMKATNKKKIVVKFK